MKCSFSIRKRLKIIVCIARCSEIELNLLRFHGRSVLGMKVNGLSTTLEESEGVEKKIFSPRNSQAIEKKIYASR